MSTTKPDTDTGWSELHRAINEMNEQPDISASDSPRLKELCRVTAMEIKAVGGAGAATSLEMIGYIRELEHRLNCGAGAEWSDEFPQAEETFYWIRHKQNHADLNVGLLRDGTLLLAEGTTHSKPRRRDFEYLPASPSDFEQLIRLRQIARHALQFRILMHGPCEHEGYMVKLCTQCEIREALAHTGEQS